MLPGYRFDRLWRAELEHAELGEATFDGGGSPGGEARDAVATAPASPATGESTPSQGQVPSLAAALSGAEAAPADTGLGTVEVLFGFDSYALDDAARAPRHSPSVPSPTPSSTSSSAPCWTPSSAPSPTSPSAGARSPASSDSKRMPTAVRSAKPVQ